MDVRIKRVYDPAQLDDGTRVLIDRLWPRGLSKPHAELDHWEKAAAPSAELRTSWHADPEGHRPDRFAAFADAYRAELASGEASDAVDRLATLARGGGRLTLLYGAKDETVNHAVVLRDAVLERARSQG